MFQATPNAYPTHTNDGHDTHHDPKKTPLSEKDPKKDLKGLSVHVSASLPSISGIYTCKGRASGASRASMAGMTVRVGTYQHTNLPTRW